MSVPLGMSFEDRFKGGISDHFVMSKANKYEVCTYVGTYYLKMCKTKESEIWNYDALYLFKNRAQAISRKFCQIQKYRYLPVLTKLTSRFRAIFWYRHKNY